MRKLAIKLSSVTYALKAKTILSRYGVYAQVERNPHPQKNEGCGYRLIVPETTLNVLDVLREERIKVLEAKWMK